MLCVIHEHHRLVLGQYQIVANRSRTDNYRQNFLQGVQTKLRNSCTKGLGGRVPCIQFVIRVLAVIYSLILDDKVVLQGFPEPKGLHPEKYAATASNDSPAVRLGVIMTALTSKGVDSSWLKSKGVQEVKRMNTLVDQLDGYRLEEIKKGSNSF